MEVGFISERKKKRKEIHNGNKEIKFGVKLAETFIHSHVLIDWYEKKAIEVDNETRTTTKTMNQEIKVWFNSIQFNQTYTHIYTNIYNQSVMPVHWGTRRRSIKKINNK